jgi:Cytochrome C''.
MKDTNSRRRSSASPSWCRNGGSSISPQLIAATVKQPLDDLEAAAKANDGPRFDAAYRQLTDACNACHKSANVGVIAIKVPDASAFPDQDFRAPKP